MTRPKAWMMALAVTFGLLAGAAQPAAAEPFLQWAPPDKAPNAVFFFGGLMSRTNLGVVVNVFGVPYTDTIIIGGGLQHDLFPLGAGFKVGGEVGAALRIDNPTSGELWFGPYLRHSGFTIANKLTISASVTGGFSAVTGVIPYEREREIAQNGNARFLFYLGPQLNFSLPDHPEQSLFWRIHHRSGLWGTLGNLSGGFNATTIGYQRRF